MATRIRTNSRVIGVARDNPAIAGGTQAGGTTDYTTSLQQLIAQLQGRTQQLASRERTLQEQALALQSEEAQRSEAARVGAENLQAQQQSESYVSLLQSIILNT